MADPFTVYNGMVHEMKILCKTNTQVMNATVLQHHFDVDKEYIFKQLILTDGQYINKYANNMQSNTLIQRQDDKINTILNNKHKTEKKVNPPSKPLHPKLRALSCFITPTNGAVNVNRRFVGNMMNENIDLDKLPQKKVYQIVVGLGKIKTDYDDIISILELRFVQELRDMNIKSHIESFQGTYAISDEIDKLCSRFLRWDHKYKQSVNDIDEKIKNINNAIIKLDLGFYSNDKNKFIPTLTQQTYDLTTKQLSTKNKGAQLFNFCLDFKRKLIKFKQEIKTLDQQIQSKRSNDIYTKYINKKRGSKIIGKSEEQRAQRYRKTNKKKKEKKDEKDNKKNKNKKNKDKKNNEENSKGKGKENQNNKINKYFTPKKANIIKSNKHHGNSGNANDKQIKFITSRKRKHIEETDSIDDTAAVGPLRKKRRFMKSANDKNTNDKNTNDIELQIREMSIEILSEHESDNEVIKNPVESYKTPIGNIFCD